MYLEYVLANDEHAKEVKLFGLGPMLLDRYRSLGETLLPRGPQARRAARGLGVRALASWARAPSTAATR